jgi:two-component system, sensor histidine kinase and response regulator
MPLECRELGISAYLTKPIGQAALLDAILTVLRTEKKKIILPRLVTRHTTPSGTQQLRILLAEDNAVNQKLAVRLLEKQGHSVVVAGNGREALDAFTPDHFDIVITDIQMPEMDGFEATASIRNQEKGTNRHQIIIAMTAHAMEGDRERCLRAGMDGYISKPIRVAELCKVIEDLMRAAVMK